MFDFFENEIEFISFEGFRELLGKADQISPDSDDVHYFALALKSGCSIWSNDKALKRQTVVKVFSTSDLLKMVDELG